MWKLRMHCEGDLDLRMLTRILFKDGEFYKLIVVEAMMTLVGIAFNALRISG